MTWGKDSYGLYDYQCKDPKRAQFDTTESLELIRDGDIVSKKKIGEVILSNKGQNFKRNRYYLQNRVPYWPILDCSHFPYRYYQPPNGPQRTMEGCTVFQRRKEQCKIA